MPTSRASMTCTIVPPAIWHGRHCNHKHSRRYPLIGVIPMIEHVWMPMAVVAQPTDLTAVCSTTVAAQSPCQDRVNDAWNHTYVSDAPVSSLSCMFASPASHWLVVSQLHHTS